MENFNILPNSRADLASLSSPVPGSGWVTAGKQRQVCKNWGQDSLFWDGCPFRISVRSYLVLGKFLLYEMYQFRLQLWLLSITHIHFFALCVYICVIAPPLLTFNLGETYDPVPSQRWWPVTANSTYLTNMTLYTWPMKLYI